MELRRAEQSAVLKVRIGEAGLSNRFALEAKQASDAARAAQEKAEAARERAESAGERAQELHKDAGEAKLASKAAAEAAASAESAARSAGTDAGKAAQAASEAARSAAEAGSARDEAGAARQSAMTDAETAAQAASEADRRAADAESAGALAQTARQGAEEAAERAAQISRSVDPLYNVRHYGVRWDRQSSALTRTGDAAGITTDTAAFAHRGSVNGSYSNPFDRIYPWSGCRLCNIDPEAYRALPAGADLRECVCAWEGDDDFSYDHPAGVWKYRPAFWGKSWEEDGCRCFDISDRDCGSYVYYRSELLGRWRGVQGTLNIDGAETAALLPKPGVPCRKTALSGIHQYAKNWGATLDSVYSCDGSMLMAIIEYASLNLPKAIGLGVVDLFAEENANGRFRADAADSTVVRIANGSYADYVLPGAVFDIGTSKGDARIGSFIVVDTAVDGDEKCVTLNAPVTVTTANFWSVHGRANLADEAIGSASGYLGVNGQSDCYYRGEVFWGNYWNYILGVYREKGTGHVWLARRGGEDGCDALDAGTQLDTGITLAGGSGWNAALGYPGRSGLLAAPAFCTEVGGGAEDPIGGYFNVNKNASTNTVLLMGANAQSGRNGDYRIGPNACEWRYAATTSSWGYSGRPRLLRP